MPIAMKVDRRYLGVNSASKATAAGRTPARNNPERPRRIAKIRIVGANTVAIVRIPKMMDEMTSMRLRPKKSDSGLTKNAPTASPICWSRNTSVMAAGETPKSSAIAGAILPTMKMSNPSMKRTRPESSSTA